MHVVFVSDCQKKSLDRTRAILDRYAIRISDRSWASPMTEEALDEIQKALRAVASRNTAVACYRNHGLRELRLRWVIGRSSAFGQNGAIAVGIRQVKRTPHLPDWARICALLAQTAGLAHDLGKGSKHFQEKLKMMLDPKMPPIGDSSRHEWVSMKLLQTMRDRKSFEWGAAWAELSASKTKHQLPFLAGPKAKVWTSVMDALDFGVLTHHRLLAPEDAQRCSETPTHRGHTQREFSQPQKLRSTDATLFSPAGELSSEVLGALARGVGRLAAWETNNSRTPAYWRASALISRAALILADHEVSSRVLDISAKKPASAGLYANTSRPHPKARAVFNQPLEWHLTSVGSRAGEILRYFVHPALPGLSDSSRETVLTPSGPGRFSWQDLAVNHFIGLRETPLPTLVFSLAGTGAGKTRMNIKAICALREDTDVVRIAAGFNLRTLTTQTHQALRTQLKLHSEEVACVIGDRKTTEKTEVLTDEDGEQFVEYETSQETGQFPDWLSAMAKGRPQVENLIGTPILVSTMDYLVHAGDPGQQGHHGRALLRIASSDLILDEIDSYDALAMVSVLRVVQCAGLFHRHVIASSATLAEPVAEALARAYFSGLAMRADLEQKPCSGRVSFIDDLLPPASDNIQDASLFPTLYRHRLDALMPVVEKQPAYRIAQLAKVEVSSDPYQAFTETIKGSVDRMHQNQAWGYAPGKKVSVGLVRVANVRTCVRVAKALAKDPRVHVCAYHSVDIGRRRQLKEHSLDRLLARDPSDGCNGNRWLLEDADIRQRVADTSGGEVIFIVVATPVEEVGRDHDFDWAVIEPSSVQSIVQIAGRVNRHRLKPIHLANIEILALNLRELLGKKKVFCRPGQEIGDRLYASHEMTTLLGSQIGKINALLRFGRTDVDKCLFSSEETKSISEQLGHPLRIIEGGANVAMAWSTQCHYNKYKLREDNRKELFRITEADSIEVQSIGPKGDLIWTPAPAASLDFSSGINPYWLTPGLPEIRALNADQSLEITFEAYDSQVTFDSDLGGY